jgi:hypothetical protein
VLIGILKWIFGRIEKNMDQKKMINTEYLKNPIASWD